MISKGLGMGMGIGDRDRSQPQSMFPLLPLLRGLPDVTLRCDPVINFRLKQRMSYLGACVTLGLDYLSDLAQWRAYCGVEDTLLRGRFSFKGSEVSSARMCEPQFSIRGTSFCLLQCNTQCCNYLIGQKQMEGMHIRSLNRTIFNLYVNMLTLLAMLMLV